MITRIKQYWTICFVLLFSTLTAYADSPFKTGEPASLKRSYSKNREGKDIIITEITLDKHTSREALIETCTSLRKENTDLTFEFVKIGRSFLGIAGKRRILDLSGTIQLPNGIRENFKAGGIFNFRYVKITYTQVISTGEYTLSMVETVD